MIGLPTGIEIETSGMRDVTPTHAQDVAAEAEAESEPEEPPIEYAEESESQDEGEGDIPPEVEKKPEPAEEKKPAPRQTKENKAEKEQPKKQESKPKKDEPEVEEQQSMFGGFSASEMIQKIHDQVTTDLQDGADLEGTLEMFEVQLAEIKKAEPDEYEALIDEFKAFIAKRDGEGGQE